MHKKLYDIVFALNIVFQAGFSGIIPAGLIFLAFYYLNNKFEFGKIFLAIGIIFSVFVGVYCMFRYAIKTTELLNKTKNKDNK